MLLCPGANFKFLENNVINPLSLVKAKNLPEERAHFPGSLFLSGLHYFFKVIIGWFLN